MAYRLLIPNDELDLISAVVSYAGLPIESPQLENAVVERDRIERSMGLIWRLLTLSKRSSDAECQVVLCLNSISHVKWTGGTLVIEGYCRPDPR